MGTLWWLASFLLYIKNTAKDLDLTALNGGTVFPIAWAWERVAEPNGIYNYFALGLVSNFVFYFLVSVIEFATWFLYLNNMNLWYAAWWFSTIGYYGSIFGLALPWIFMAVHIDIQMEGYIDTFPGIWALVILIITLAMWLSFAVVHIIYVPQFLLHITALKKPACICSLPFVDPAAEKATEAKKASIKKANEEREFLCSIQCPDNKNTCPLEK